MPIAAWWMLGGAIAGLIVGSFVATLVIRWPQGRTLSGRSACDACGRTLSLRDLVPVVSWALAGGKCRSCAARINWRHPVIEIACAFTGMIALGVASGMAGVAGAVLGWQLLALAALDAEHYWLPDRLTLALSLSGLAAGVAGIGVDMVARLIGGTLGFGALFALAWAYRRLRGREGMGEGDPKLLGAIGCWLGWQALPMVLIGASLVGLSAVLVMRVRGKAVAATTRLPLGALMAVTAFPLWILTQR